MRFLERPSSWYDPPDEPSDAEEEACREAWTDYLADYCDECDWGAVDSEDKARLMPGERACDACAEHEPQTYDDWCSDWHEEQRRRSYD